MGLRSTVVGLGVWEMGGAALLLRVGNMVRLLSGELSAFSDHSYKPVALWQNG
jgi:hypothetical protein